MKTKEELEQENLNLQNRLGTLAEFLTGRKENTEGTVMSDTAVDAAIRTIYTMDERREQAERLGPNLGPGIIVECRGSSETFQAFVARPDGTKGEEIMGITRFALEPLEGAEDPVLMEANIRVQANVRLNLEAGLLRVEHEQVEKADDTNP